MPNPDQSRLSSCFLVLAPSGVASRRSCLRLLLQRLHGSGDPVTSAGDAGHVGSDHYCNRCHCLRCSRRDHCAGRLRPQQQRQCCPLRKYDVNDVNGYDHFSRSSNHDRSPDHRSPDDRTSSSYDDQCGHNDHHRTPGKRRLADWSASWYSATRPSELRLLLLLPAEPYRRGQERQCWLQRRGAGNHIAPYTDTWLLAEQTEEVLAPH